MEDQTPIRFEDEFPEAAKFLYDTYSQPPRFFYTDILSIRRPTYFICGPLYFCAK